MKTKKVLDNDSEGTIPYVPLKVAVTDAYRYMPEKSGTREATVSMLSHVNLLPSLFRKGCCVVRDGVDEVRARIGCLRELILLLLRIDQYSDGCEWLLTDALRKVNEIGDIIDDKEFVNSDQVPRFATAPRRDGAVC
ncbi:MAG: hypothetical protein E3K36_04305 [Candidatus Brocadia sp.]|nr:hypothetical protein [Candidatus Brocadia sp.]